MEYLAPPLETSPTALKEQFDTAMASYFPGWNPGAGNLAERIAGAQSLIDAQLMEAAAEGATNVFRFYGAKIADIPPVEAVQATGSTTWTATDTLGHTIPIGTIVIFTNGLGNRVAFETTAEATITAGQSLVENVPIRAQLPGEEANSISGLATELQSPLSFIASVNMPSPSNGGSEAESDEAYLNRLTEKLRTLSPSPITPTDFDILVGEKSGVGRVTTLRGVNPTGTLSATGTTTNTSNEVTGLTAATTEKLLVGTEVTGTGIPANTFIIEVGSTTIKLSANATASGSPTLTFTGLQKQPGYVCSVVGKANGEELSSGEMATIESEVGAECLAGVEFKVIKPKYTTITPVVNVVAWPGQNATTIKEAVEAALKEYLSPENWGKAPTGQASKEFNNDPKVRFVNVEHRILQVVGTHYISSLTLNGGTSDITMAGIVALPKCGTPTVNVSLG